MAEHAEQVSTTGLVDTKQAGATKRRQYPETLKQQMVAETLVPGRRCRLWRGATM
jgi:hypothetical protein